MRLNPASFPLFIFFNAPLSSSLRIPSIQCSTHFRAPFLTSPSTNLPKYYLHLPTSSSRVKCSSFLIFHSQNSLFLIILILSTILSFLPIQFSAVIMLHSSFFHFIACWTILLTIHFSIMYSSLFISLNPHYKKRFLSILSPVSFNLMHSAFCLLF